MSWVPVTHSCNPSYSGGRDQEAQGSKPAWRNNSRDPISKILIMKRDWWSGSRCRPWVQTPVPPTKKWFVNQAWWFCFGSLLAEIRDTEAISRKQCFIVPTQTQRTGGQRLSPENKGVSPYTPLQAGYRSKKQGLVHIRLYLILLPTLPQVLRDFPSVVLCDLPHVQISQVWSFSYAIPTSLLLSQDSGLDCFLLILLPATVYACNPGTWEAQAGGWWVWSQPGKKGCISFLRLL
jgi:hypothetical protein